MKVDLARSLRRIKPERWTGTLTPRDRSKLDVVEDAPHYGLPLLLDTCVYLDVLEGRLSPAAKLLLTTRPLRHVSVVLGELAHLFGRLPRTSQTQPALAKLAVAIEAIEERHVLAPSAGVVLEAGVLCGLVFRLGGFQKGQEVAALNDATIYLHATASGQTVLTRNRNDFDRMNQIVPSGRVLFY